jgi:DNA topoisomerase I
VKACQELPGQNLVEYLDDDGKPQVVTSTDVNGYLKEITGKDTTTKDFRTWAGTVLAATALSAMQSFESTAGAKKNVRTAIESVATRLGNTRAICRRCYVHPEVLSAYLGGNLASKINHVNLIDNELREVPAELNPDEAAVLCMLQSLRTRLERDPVAAKITREPQGQLGPQARQPETSRDLAVNRRRT